MEHLIDFEKIANAGPLGVVLLLVILVVSIAVLTKGADWLVEGAAQLAYRFGISKIIVGATVVSLGTTAPEAAVSVLAAVKGQSGFALGNAVGSVICDTGLIFGLGCVLTSLPMDRFILNRHGWLQFGSGCLLVLIAVGSYFIFGDAIITRPIGIMLLALLVGYLFISVKWSKQHPTAGEDVPGADLRAWACVGLIVVGVTMVVLSAQTLIGSAEQLGLIIGVPRSIISATLVALGTSLPELATAITSIRKGHPEILIGNIVGADILNILFVVGASSTAVSLPVPKEFFTIHFPVMILILLIFRISIFASHRKQSFSRWWGLPLLVIYASYIGYAYLMR